MGENLKQHRDPMTIMRLEEDEHNGRERAD